MSADTEVTYLPPKGEVEVTLAKIWEELLQVERVGRNDDFIALGGTSLAIIVLIAALNNQFQVAVKSEDVFQNSTLFRLAKVVDNLRFGGGEASRKSDGAFDDLST